MNAVMLWQLVKDERDTKGTLVTLAKEFSLSLSDCSKSIREGASVCVLASVPDSAKWPEFVSAIVHAIREGNATSLTLAVTTAKRIALGERWAKWAEEVKETVRIVRNFA